MDISNNIFKNISKEYSVVISIVFWKYFKSMHNRYIKEYSQNLSKDRNNHFIFLKPFLEDDAITIVQKLNQSCKTINGTYKNILVE